MKRLALLNHRQPTSTWLLGPTARLVDGRSFLEQWREIFVREVYRFRARRGDPVILDGGANIGLATLYWKQTYPAACVIAFEPDPEVYRILSANVDDWGLSGTRLVNAALWTSEGEQRFWPEGTDSGRLLAAAPAPGKADIRVRTVRLRDYLTSPVDLLKLDIEGAEADVLEDCADRLSWVESIFAEYHSFIGRTQRLDSVLSVLRSAGFRLYLQPQLLIASPFVNRLDHNGLDQTMSIFAWREAVA